MHRHYSHSLVHIPDSQDGPCSAVFGGVLKQLVHKDDFAETPTSVAMVPTLGDFELVVHKVGFIAIVIAVLHTLESRPAGQETVIALPPGSRCLLLV